MKKPEVRNRYKYRIKYILIFMLYGNEKREEIRILTWWSHDKKEERLEEYLKYYKWYLIYIVFSGLQNSILTHKLFFFLQNRVMLCFFLFFFCFWDIFLYFWRISYGCLTCVRHRHVCHTPTRVRHVDTRVTSSVHVL